MHGHTKITIETTERVSEYFVNLSYLGEIPNLVKQLRDLRKHQQEQYEDIVNRLKRQDIKMAELGVDFTAFNEAVTRQLAEINTQIQQLVEAAAHASTVAELRNLIGTAQSSVNAATETIQASADALAADNPVVPPDEPPVPQSSRR